MNTPGCSFEIFPLFTWYVMAPWICAVPLANCWHVVFVGVSCAGAVIVTCSALQSLVAVLLFASPLYVATQRQTPALSVTNPPVVLAVPPLRFTVCVNRGVPVQLAWSGS